MSPQKPLPKKCGRKNATSLHGGPHQPSKTVFRVHETTVFRNGPEPSKVEKLIEKAVLLESILVPTVAKLHKMVIEIRCSIVCSIVCSILCSISGSILCSIWVQVACVATHGRPDLATFRLIGVNYNVGMCDSCSGTGSVDLGSNWSRWQMLISMFSTQASLLL